MSGLKGSELKKRIATGAPILGAWLTITDPVMARIYSQLGFDFLLIDTEHNAMNPETLQTVLLMLEGTNTCPIVRVPWHEPTWSKWALDAGAEGILFPNVVDENAARQVVSNCKYPPQGTRGFFPKVASNFLMNMQDYVKGINERIQVWIQIESVEGIRNLPKILKVDGIDSIFIGPADLSSSLGILHQYENPLFKEAMQTIITQTRQAGLPVAYPASESPEKIIDRIHNGIQIITIGQDFAFAHSAAVKQLDEVKKGLGDIKP
jgi:4-hydroxy-2-oxoheptanedioate aldolase